MHHLEWKGAHYEMGVERGRFFQKNGVTFPLHLDEFQLRHGNCSEPILKEFFPEVCEEIRGVSDTIGIPYSIFSSWLLCMGCCMYRLEENIPVEIRGCTAFACSQNGQIIYGRNNDLPPYLQSGSKSEIYSPLHGHQFHMATSSFINGEEGLNEHGLAVAMTFVMTDLADIRAGFNSCFLVRYLLEKADSTEHALSLLAKLPVASNCNILLADRTGHMAVAECTPREKRLREAVNMGSGKIICTVNSFSSDEMKKYDAAGGNDYDSAERYRTVINWFLSHANENLMESAKRLLKGTYGFICQYDDEPDFETVWSSVFDLKSLMVFRSEGDPRKIPFLRDRRLHELVQKNSVSSGS